MWHVVETALDHIICIVSLKSPSISSAPSSGDIAGSVIVVSNSATDLGGIDRTDNQSKQSVCH